MSTHGVETAFLIVIVAILVIVRQLGPKRVTTLTLIGLPLVAGFEAVQNLPPIISPLHCVEFLATILVSVLAGFIQTSNTRVLTRPDGMYYQGGFIYLGAWLGLIATRFIIELAFQGSAALTHFHDNEWMLFADIAIAWGTRSALLCLRYPQLVHELQQRRHSRRTH